MSLFKQSVLTISIGSYLFSIISPAYANIQADSSAHTAYRPVISVTQNPQKQNIPLIQIQTPQHGISHNKYSQFDIQSQGAILNNSRTGSHSQLAGKSIAGNPFLAQGEALTILNEVNSNRASQIAGNVEIAGQKANLIIANPNGLNIQGAGFINAHQAILTTGQVKSTENGLEYDVQKGKVNIQSSPNHIGIGGRNNNADYVHIYSQALEANAEIHANREVKVIAGQNNINEREEIKNLNPKNSQQAEFAIDVKNLGGLYADHIYLIGTAQGLGVRQAGRVQAKNQFIIDAQGKVEQLGHIQSTAGTIQIKTTDALKQQGQIQSQSDTSIQAKNIDIQQSQIRNTQGNMNIAAVSGISIQNSQLNSQGELNIYNENQNIQLTQNQLSSKDAMNVIALNGQIQQQQNHIQSTQGHVNLSSSQTQTINHSTINAGKNVFIQSGQDLVITNSRVNADNALALMSNEDQTTQQSHFTAKQGEIFSTTLGTHHIQGENHYTGGAVSLQSQNIVFQNEQSQINMTATGSEALKQFDQQAQSDYLAKKSEKPTLLAPNQINGSIEIKTEQDLNINPEQYRLSAQGDIELHSEQGKLTLDTAKNKQVLTLNTQGEVRLFGDDVEVKGSQIQAKKDILIQADTGNVVVDGVQQDFANKKMDQKLVELNKQLAQAKAELDKFKQSAEYKEYQAKKKAFDDLLNDMMRMLAPMIGASGVMHHISIHNAKLLGVIKEQEKNILPKEKALTDKVTHFQNEINFFNNTVSGFEHQTAKLTSQQGDIYVQAKQGMALSGAIVTATQGDIALMAEGVFNQPYKQTAQHQTTAIQQGLNSSVLLDGLVNFYERGRDGSDFYQSKSQNVVTTLNAGKDITIKATTTQPNTHLVLQGAKIQSGANLNISANHHILFDTAVDDSYRFERTYREEGKWYNKKKITTETSDEYRKVVPVELTANQIDIQAQGIASHINAYATQMNTPNQRGNIHLNSTGDINLYAVHDQHHYQQNSVARRKYLGIIKGNTSHGNHSRNQITAIPATLTANYIQSQSAGDTRLEGTQFNYLQGAKIQARGKIHLLTANSVIKEHEQNKSNSVVWQSVQDKGRIHETASLPIFRGLVRPEFIAEGGLVVQIPVKNSEVSQQQLRAEILKLSQEQGNEYLRELVERKDIDWQQIVLTQKDWDYKQQGLTPAGAAILAIAITIATSGAGSAISGSVSGSLTNTLGASTANAVGAMSSAAFTSLVSQAGIALVNNQGDIKKTLKQLGQKDSIKQLATSVVTAGLLNKIGGTQWASKFSGTDLDDRVIKAMIDSTARAVVETGINGGSLSENLERALKAGLLNAVHGELAENIKGLEDNYYLLHKLAHAAAGCAVGAVQKQCEAGAIGAAVGEVVANAMPPKNGVFYSDKEKETIKYAGQLVAGVVSAYAGHDAQSAMNFAQVAIENNGAKDWLKLQTELLSSKASAQGKNLLDRWETLVRKGDIDSLKQLKSQIDDYLNSQYQKRQLSEAEMHVFGVMAGITEAVFPTHVLDFAGGLGKGIDKGTDAAKALMSAKEYAKNNFRYVFTSRNANTPILPNTPYHPSVVEARKLTAQQKEDWIISLPTKILQQPIKMPDGRVVKIDVDLEPTIRRILDNKPNSTLQDGKPYLNNTTPLLPKNISYTEWVVPTVAVNGRGTQRIVVGSDGSMWYTPNHFGYIRPDMSKPISPSNKPIGNTWRRIK